MFFRSFDSPIVLFVPFPIVLSFLLILPLFHCSIPSLQSFVPFDPSIVPLFHSFKCSFHPFDPSIVPLFHSFKCSFRPFDPSIVPLFHSFQCSFVPFDPPIVLFVPLILPYCSIVPFLQMFFS